MPLRVKLAILTILTFVGGFLQSLASNYLTGGGPRPWWMFLLASAVVTMVHAVVSFGWKTEDELHGDAERAKRDARRRAEIDQAEARAAELRELNQHAAKALKDGGADGYSRYEKIDEARARRRERE